MPQYKLSPYDPSPLLCDRVEALLRSGPANCAAINPAAPAWGKDDPAPPAHFLFPLGTRLYLAHEGGSVKCDPMAVIIGSNEALKAKSEEIQDAWNLALSIKVRVGKDFPPTELESVINGIIWFLFRPLVLDDTTTQHPQARLNTSGLLVFGDNWRDNFADLSITEIEEEENHPEQEILASVVCAATHQL